MARTIVVIGGAGGGPVAAAKAREIDEHARIVLVEKKPEVSWVQAGLRHHLEGRVVDIAAIETDRRVFFAERHRIELLTSTEAVQLDPESQRVVLRTKNGNEALRYDAAIFSGGAELLRPDVAGLSGPRVMGFRTASDLVAIQNAKAAGAKRAVVIGAGSFGVDAAEGLHAAGFSVDVVEKRDRILPSMSLLGAQKAASMLVREGLTLHTKATVQQATPRGDGFDLTLSNGKRLEADIVVLALGLVPSTQWLLDAGASLNTDGSVRVSAEMQTTLPNVYACGTAVSIQHAITRAPLWLPQAAIAARTAQIAGRNAALGRGATRDALAPLAGSALFVVGGMRFARTGLSEGEARSVFGGDRITVITVHGYAGEPWVGGDALCVRLVVDRGHNAVVGGEVWGREGVPRRIDLISAAVSGSWSPQKLTDLDLAYAPTLGPASDPLALAGSFAAMTLLGEANPISAEALALYLARGDELQIIDVSRQSRDTDDNMWPSGTRRITLEALRGALTSLARDKPTIVVSHTGQRAYQAYRILVQNGFSNVKHLDGGSLSFALVAGGQHTAVGRSAI